MAFVDWIESTALSIWMIDSIWAYPIVLSTHAVGMSIVVGTIVIVDLRILGFASKIPLNSFGRLFIVSWIGVALNFLSGVALFTADPAQFLYHPVFWIKIGLIIVGAVLVYVMWREVKPDKEKPDENSEASARTRSIAKLSLLLWAGVIVAGRLIAYIELS
ncbi:MAG: DUF2214 family protein [Gammaproteobacteria bacterium]|jgi:hypothetical protein|nr:DUF2214 family protein [Gammaproteobacteria bacterium]